MATIASIQLETAYQFCENLARSHYENFPVASFFLPAKIRRPIAAVYAFARTADDIADEGSGSSQERLLQLEHYWDSLEAITQHHTPTEPIFIALKDTLAQNPSIPIELFFDLLRAFKQDVLKKEYRDFQEILNYCQLSANPVGRILLYLTNQATAQNLKDSDSICTALQLINFLQDIHADLVVRQRCYLPTEEMEPYAITNNTLMAKKESTNLKQLITTQLDRAQTLLESGSKLGNRLSGLFGFEIRLIIQGGRYINQQLRLRTSVYERPVLKIWHWPLLLGKAIGKR